MHHLTFTKTLALALAAGAVCGASADNFYWRKGSDCDNAGWGEAARWNKGSRDSGVHAVPGAGDVIRLNGDKNARVTDKDWGTFSNLNEIVMGEGAHLTLDFTEDRNWNGSFQGSNGRVIKINSNRFTSTRTGSNQQFKGGTFVVSNGTFSIAGCLNYYCSVYDVVAPGQLEIRGSNFFYMGALKGDGVVYRTESGKQLFFVGALMDKWSDLVVDKPPYVFSGTFSNSVPISFGDSVTSGAYTGWFGPHDEQYFTGVTSTNLVNSPPRFYKGVVNLAAWGTSSAGTTPSSLGNSDTFNLFGRTGGCDEEIGARFCGTAPYTARRTFQVFNRAPGTISVVDGGETGGLTYSGNLQSCIASDGKTECYYGLMSRVAFRGDAGTNVFSGSVSHFQTETNSFAVLKQGASTWRFTEDVTYKGPTFVERGTLLASTLRDPGEACALGTGTLLYTNYYAQTKQAATGPVPFGQMLGDGTAAVTPETGTLAYEGTSRVVLEKRPFALRGAGRVAQTGTGALHLTGAYGAQTGANALVLDAPAGATNYFTHVTNGLGTLKVVKEGAGTWVLNGSVDLADGVEVKAGTLEVASRTYSWHRLFIKRCGAGADCFMLRKYVLAGETGDYPDNVLDFGLSRNASADGSCAFNLGPGEQAFYNDNVNQPNSTRLVQNIFQNDNSICYLVPVNGFYESSTLGMIGIVTRLPESAAQRVTRYDFQAEDPNARNALKWSLDGSWDGIHWNELHAYETNEIPVSAIGRWYAANSTAWSGGWSIAGEDAACARCVAKVQVAAGATFVSRDPVTVSGITLDAAGGGTVKGVAYASTGTIDVTGLSSGDFGRKIPFGFEADSGWANVANWTFTVDGEPTATKVVRVLADGVVVSKSGTCVILR